MIYIFQFLNMAFPKAGIMIQTVPLTAAVASFGLALITLWPDRRMMYKIPCYFRIIYFSFVLLIVIITVCNYQHADARQLAMAMVIAVSPLAALLGYKAGNCSLAKQIVSIALIITGFYAILQYLFGIEATTIHGVNLALGDSWAAKPIAVSVGDNIKYVKWPATYQNGNLAAAFYILAIPLILAWRTENKANRYLQFVSLLLGFCGLLLSGSRSALYPFIVVWALISVIYIVWQHRDGFIYLLMLLAGIMLTFALVAFLKPDSPPQNFMMDRYVQQTQADPTASNRTIQWNDGFQQIQQEPLLSKLRIFSIGQSWKQLNFMEGFSALGMTFGFITMALFIMLLLGSIYMVGWKTSSSAIIALGLLAGFLQFTIDSPFWQPPTLINWFFIAGLAVKRIPAALKQL